MTKKFLYINRKNALKNLHLDSKILKPMCVLRENVMTREKYYSDKTKTPT